MRDLSDYSDRGSCYTVDCTHLNMTAQTLRREEKVVKLTNWFGKLFYHFTARFLRNVRKQIVYFRFSFTIQGIGESILHYC